MGDFTWDFTVQQGDDDVVGDCGRSFNLFNHVHERREMAHHCFGTFCAQLLYAVGGGASNL